MKSYAIGKMRQKDEKKNQPQNTIYSPKIYNIHKAIKFT